MFCVLVENCFYNIRNYSAFLYFFPKANSSSRLLFRSVRLKVIFCSHPLPTGNYMVKVYNGNTRARCEICSRLTIKTPEQCRHRCGVFIVNLEHISHLFLVFPLLTLSR